jgi:hypothetical protein
LANPWSLAPLAADSWIKSTWQFVQEYGIEIQDDIEEFWPLRDFDQLLIPTFYRLGYRGSDLVRLNQCRLFLQVTWLSEIVTGDGKSIELHAIEPPYALDIKELFCTQRNKHHQRNRGERGKPQSKISATQEVS